MLRSLATLETQVQLLTKEVRNLRAERRSMPKTGDVDFELPAKTPQELMALNKRVAEDTSLKQSLVCVLPTMSFGLD